MLRLGLILNTLYLDALKILVLGDLYLLFKPCFRDILNLDLNLITKQAIDFLQRTSLCLHKVSATL